MTIREEIKLFREEFEPLFQASIEKIYTEQLAFSDIRTDFDQELLIFLKKYAEGGKRIRPFLVYFFSGKKLTNESLKNICLASELFHLAALIHDDIIDEAKERRGEKTLHIALEKYQENNIHLGLDIALLLGDIFLSAALSYAQKTEIHFKDFNTMIMRTIRGQVLDSSAMNKEYGEISEDELLSRHELKTAYYTFLSPGLLGNKICENKHVEEELAFYLRKLGILFQIRDDIIDCTDKNSGKKLYGDILEGQTTWVTLKIKKDYQEIFTELKEAGEEKSISKLDNIFKQINLQKIYREKYNSELRDIEQIDDVRLKKQLLDIISLLKIN